MPNEDDMDDIFEEEETMGGDTVTCPECGAEVPLSLFFDDEAECPECGMKFSKSDAGYGDVKEDDEEEDE